MEDLGTLQIETKRLILRKKTIDDAKMIFENYASDERATRFLRWNTHKKIDRTFGMLKKYEKEIRFNDTYWWGIVLKKTNQLFGYISVISIDREENSMEIEYCTGEKFWYKGYSTEAIVGVLEFLFNRVGVTSIYMKHQVDNTHSGKVMLRCGFKYVYDNCMQDKNENEQVYRVYCITKEDMLDARENVQSYLDNKMREDK